MDPLSGGQERGRRLADFNTGVHYSYYSVFTLAGLMVPHSLV